MNEPLDILYVGPLHAGQTCLQRMEGLRELGHKVEGMDPYPPEYYESPLKLATRISWRLIGYRDIGNINGRILEKMQQGRFNVLWIDKGLLIEARTLRRVRELCPGCTIVGYSPDDMMCRAQTSRQFRGHLPLYDIFFTTKSYGVEELKRAGARRVEFVANSYDPKTHRPMAVTAEDRARYGGPVGFIGDYEAERAESMRMLARNGVPVRIWGTNWDKLKHREGLLKVENKPVLGEEYGRAICSFDINLGFLRKLARDLQTTRSVEIPACGGFMLAERTNEHQALFEEGREAEFFGSNEELLSKVKHYMEHPEERMRIADAGRERCVNGQYSNKERLGALIARVEAIRSEA
ncbi:MAG TPA: glycosyltransferase [Tepidisphaeraceae bacterium]|jgi:hypothetical protein|nr:glycosyltransferase [Tepidisphaeraceae bacterium]